MDATITYFPVGNGDATLIRLSDNTTILVDCNLSEDSEDPDVPGSYDVREHLLQVLKRDDSGRPHVGVFILTHPDQDHIRGLTRAFYLGDPAKYTDDDEKEKRIITDELWFAPRVFSPHEGDLCDDAKAYRREAARRIALYRSKAAARSNPGNRLRVIGYSDVDALDGLDDVLTVPGEELNLINGQVRSDFSFFVHGPLKKDSDDKWADRNDTSIILQARFTVDDVPRAALALMGGDAGCAIWEQVVDLSKRQDLEWDLFLAPHHCSWSFFSEAPEDDDEPSEKIMSLLGKRRKGAWVVASSKPIKDDDDSPPSHKAAEAYRKAVGKDHFLCTGEHPDEDEPTPICFIMSANGPVQDDSNGDGDKVVVAATTRVVTEPTTYGRCWPCQIGSHPTTR